MTNTHEDEVKKSAEREVNEEVAQAFLAGIAGKEGAEVLGVNPGASIEDIKSAYKALAKRYHGDKYFSASHDLRRLVDTIMTEVNLAFAEALRNTVRGDVPPEFQGFWGEFEHIKAKAEMDAEKSKGDLKEAAIDALVEELQSSKKRLQGLGDAVQEGVALSYEQQALRLAALLMYLDRLTGKEKIMSAAGLERTVDQGGETELKIKEEFTSDAVKRIQAERGPFDQLFVTKDLILAVKNERREKLVWIFKRDTDGRYTATSEQAWHRLVGVTREGIPILQDRIGGSRVTIPESRLLLPNGELSAPLRGSLFGTGRGQLSTGSKVYDEAGRLLDVTALARQFLPVTDPNNMPEQLDDKVKQLPEWKKE